MFPDNFLFGSNVSDYQHFGNSKCDLPKLSSVNHKKYYAKDFQFIDQLHLSAFRFNIEWARIEPKENFIDKKAIEFYHNYFNELKKHNVKIFVTLHHFTNPNWVHKYNGFESKYIKNKFLDYTALIAKEFKNDIDYFIIFNEPSLYLCSSLITAKLPPFNKNNIFGMLKSMKNILEIHSEAYKIIKNINPAAKVGSVNAISIVHNKNKLLSSMQNMLMYFPNIILNRTSKNSDFIGLNYYVAFKNLFKKKYEINPDSLRHILNSVYSKHKKPIIITENGIPTKNDDLKSAYLIEHLKAVEDSIEKDHIKIDGYFNWCFLHGYEWNNGFNSNFSIIDVDLNTMERKLTEAGKTYSQIIQQNSAKLFDLKKEIRSELCLFDGWPFNKEMKCIDFKNSEKYIKQKQNKAKIPEKIKHYFRFLRCTEKSKAINKAQMPNTDGKKTLKNKTTV